MFDLVQIIFKLIVNNFLIIYIFKLYIFYNLILHESVNILFLLLLFQIVSLIDIHYIVPLILLDIIYKNNEDLDGHKYLN
jgi:hypothetical protein